MRLDGLMIWVEDVPATVEFYRAAFDIAPRWVRDEGDYAQLETGDVVLQFAAAGAAGATGVDIRLVSPTDQAPGIQLSLTTDDVAGAMSRAIAAGGIEVVTPVVKPWGQTIGYVRDLNGVLVELATPGD